MKNYKIFHDTVHGDIMVPSKYCKEIIDTHLFQRLRRIEQTSMRSLYPCARHDRFIHSIGVFHLGSILVKSIQTNTAYYFKELWTNKIEQHWSLLENSFKLACLLHDVGHSPFSHTFEDLFDRDKVRLSAKLFQFVDEASFADDYKSSLPPKSHEIISAYLVCKHYKTKIEGLGGSPFFMARMILGISYKNPQNTLQMLVNALIPFLHGTIDVDRLDYAARDQWASGFTSSKININRILSAPILVSTKSGQLIVPCFLKGAVDQFDALLNIKNYQSSWIFTHQKILYDQYVLEKAIERMIEIYSESTGQNCKEVLSAIFNLSIYDDPKYTFNGVHLYLLSDDDLIHLIKQNLDDNLFASEWLSRNHRLSPIWKNEVEYKTLIPKWAYLTKDKVAEFLTLHLNSDNFLLVPVKKEAKGFLPGEVNLFLNEKVIDYLDLKISTISDGIKSRETSMFYIYINQSNSKLNKTEIIDKLKIIAEEEYVLSKERLQEVPIQIPIHLTN